jgi:hypothetical protein
MVDAANMDMIPSMAAWNQEIAIKSKPLSVNFCFLIAFIYQIPERDLPYDIQDLTIVCWNHRVPCLRLLSL